MTLTNQQRQEVEMRKQEGIAASESSSGKRSDKYYAVRVVCSNCSYARPIEVLKGTSWQEIAIKLVCQNCGIGDFKEFNRINHCFTVED